MKKVLIIFIIISGFLSAQDWIDITPEGLTYFSISDIEFMDESTLLYIGGITLYISEDKGSTWTSKEIPYIFGMYIAHDSNNNIYCSGLGGLVKTTDMGDTWTRLDDSFNQEFLEFSEIVVHNDTVYTSNLDDLYYSADFGATWVATNLNAYESNLYVDDNYIYGGSYALSGAPFHRSSDRGQTWENTGIATVDFTHYGNGNMLLYSIDEGLLTSTDNGANWTSIDPFASSDYDVTTVGSVPGVAYLLQVNSSDIPSGLYTSTNPASGWRLIGFENVYEVIMTYDDEDVLYAGASDVGLFYYTGPLTPVELSGFNAVVNNGSVNLKWETATETNNKEFIVERKSSVSSEWVNLGNIEGKGTTTEKQNYSFNDYEPAAGINYYRLKQIDFDGTFSYSQIVEVEMLPTRFSVEQNYPNPFNPSTKIRFSLPEESNVKLTIYNNLGQVVNRAVNESFNAGSNVVELNATSLSSGIYFYEINATGMSGKVYKQTRKMILMK